MKFLLVIFSLLSTALSAKESQNLTELANDYFEKMVATQMPNANEKDIERYLALLMDDVGHTHLPWDIDDERNPDGKKLMKEGMSFYLGTHSAYKAELLNVYTFNDSAVAIRYQKWSEGIHPQTGQPIKSHKVYLEVLELEGNKISVIRKYHE
ncbi:MAG: nuclear transport factor 2 family protein [Gammaproteobacteria bacterium]|nr:nuclear transport factor 2 family protein [Gammaproteobacteria bacterium]